MSALTPALRHRASRPNWEVIFAADAEGANAEDNGGFGVVMTPIEQTLWEKTLAAGCRPGFTVAKLDGSTAHLRDARKELEARIPVSRVPHEVLSTKRFWAPIAQGRWRHREHITLGEGRATLVLLQRLAAMPEAHGHRHLDLCDNLPWSAATAKGRSPAYALNRLLQKRAALQISSDLQLIHPWVDTHRMPADDISRQK